MVPYETNLVYICIKICINKKRNNYSFLVYVHFQFDWHFIELNNSDAVYHRLTFPPSGLLFQILEVPGIGLISLWKSAGFGSAGSELLWLFPETDHFL